MAAVNTYAQQSIEDPPMALPSYPPLHHVVAFHQLRYFVVTEVMAPSPLPEFVYKIVPSAPPTPIPAQYPLSDLDQKDGFVHLSTGTQIPITAGLFFKEATAIWVLKIRFAPKFHSATTWEIEGCPHLYGNFGAEDVEGVKEFSRLDGQGWKESLENERGWLA